MSKASAGNRAVRIAVINGGVSDPSSTRLLLDRITQKAIDALTTRGFEATVSTIDLGPIAVDIVRSLVSGLPSAPVQAAIDRLAAADAIVVGTPVYKAGISGLVKSFADLLDNDLLLAKPIVLAATGGSARHSMVVDEQLRPLFAFLRSIPAPTSLYAAPEDWSSSDLGRRIARAANELAALVGSGVASAIADENWDKHDHRFSGNASRTERGADDVDFGSELMRLAAGGPSGLARSLSGATLGGERLDG
jgi:FMN reductase